MSLIDSRTSPIGLSQPFDTFSRRIRNCDPQLIDIDFTAHAVPFLTVHVAGIRLLNFVAMFTGSHVMIPFTIWVC